MRNISLRTDLAIIASLIPHGAKVLDVGCSDGTLLAYLAEHKQVDARGIELSQALVSNAVKEGLSVIQGDADTDLKHYPDKCFDCIISSQMLQATHKPKEVLEEMLRIAHTAIISIPNFGYWRNRFYLLLHGKMPVTKTLHYEWYETPNIHFSTIKDFKELCKKLHFTVEKVVFLDGASEALRMPYSFLPNFYSETAVFTLKKAL